MHLPLQLLPASAGVYLSFDMYLNDLINVTRLAGVNLYSIQCLNKALDVTRISGGESGDKTEKEQELYFYPHERGVNLLG